MISDHLCKIQTTTFSGKVFSYRSELPLKKSVKEHKKLTQSFEPASLHPGHLFLWRRPNLKILSYLKSLLQLTPSHRKKGTVISVGHIKLRASNTEIYDATRSMKAIAVACSKSCIVFTACGLLL